ncbi:hypothetical protein [Serratia sp. (in: enterobacteria)]|uniref:hypothetical protein n=1 Tax=Serratia sp. (in: enterobacteria) TaxID=616 RepID=UPI00398A301D
MIVDALNEITKRILDISEDHVNDIIEMAMRELIKSGDFHSGNFNPETLNEFYKTVLRAYIEALEMKFEQKSTHALDEINDPDAIRRAEADPLFQEFRRKFGI